jgi:hypothetical protein
VLCAQRAARPLSNGQPSPKYYQDAAAAHASAAAALVTVEYALQRRVLSLLLRVGATRTAALALAGVNAKQSIVSFASTVLRDASEKDAARASAGTPTGSSTGTPTSAARRLPYQSETESQPLVCDGFGRDHFTSSTGDDAASPSAGSDTVALADAVVELLVLLSTSARPPSAMRPEQAEECAASDAAIACALDTLCNTASSWASTSSDDRLRHAFERARVAEVRTKTVPTRV